MNIVTLLQGEAQGTVPGTGMGQRLTRTGEGRGLVCTGLLWSSSCHGLHSPQSTQRAPSSRGITCLFCGSWLPTEVANHGPCTPSIRIMALLGSLW